MATFSDIIFNDDIQLDNIHAQDINLTYDELITQDYTYLSEAPFTTPVSFNTQTTYIIKAVSLDDNRVLVTFTDTGVRSFIVLSKNGNIITAKQAITGYTTLIPDMIKVDNNKVLFASEYTTQYGRMFLIDTSGGTITFGGATEFDSNSISKISLDKLSNGTVIVTYLDDSLSVLKAQIIYYNSTLNTVTTNQSNITEFNDGLSGTTTQVVAINATKAIVVYANPSFLGGAVEARILTISGAIITSNIPYTVDSDGSRLHMRKINQSKMLLCYKSFLYNTGRCAILEISEDAVLVNTPKTFNSNYVGYSLACTVLSEDIGIVTYSENIITNTPKITILQLTDGELEIQETQTLSTAQSAEYRDIVTVGSQGFIAFTDDDDSFYGKSILLEAPAATGLYDYEQPWNSTSTVFLANFEDNLEAGNITETFDGWRLKRKASDGSLFITIDDFEYTERSYIDYLPRNSIAYTYSIFALNTAGESLGIEETTSVTFYGWILTDGTNSYKFDAGWDHLKTDSINSNIDYHEYENYTQYPITSYGQRNYKTSSLTTIPYSFNSTTLECEITLTLLNTIRDFINNGDDKWLKNTAGEIFKVSTHGFDMSYSDKIPSQPYQIKFEWTEIDTGEEGL